MAPRDQEQTRVLSKNVEEEGNGDGLSTQRMVSVGRVWPRRRSGYYTYLGAAKRICQLSKERLANGNYDRTRISDYTGRR